MRQFKFHIVKFHLAACLLAASALTAPMAAAQQTVPSDDDTPTPQQALPDTQPVPDDDQTTGSLSGEDDPCRAQPEENGAQAGQKPDEGDDQQAGDTAALSDKLGACNGVLKPPPTGESEMVQPAPNIGETPVIPPGQLPEQQNSDPNARS